MSCVKFSRFYIPNLITNAAVVPEICNKIVKQFILEFIIIYIIIFANILIKF